MRKYYPLLRREVIRLALPMLCVMIALISYMSNLGESLAAEGRTFARYGMYYGNMHPSNLLRAEYCVIAAGLGMVLSLVQHFAERSSQSALYWEMLPYSRWEKMYVKTMCAMVPIAVFCAIGYKWMGGIVFANADWINELNAGIPGLDTLNVLLRTDRIMAHWIFLFVGALAGYALFTFLCQIYAGWWRAALVGGFMFLMLADMAGGGRNYIYWETVINGEKCWVHANDTMRMLPEMCIALLAAAGLLFASFMLEKNRPFERTGSALFRPQMQGYVVGAVVVLGLLSTVVWSHMGPFFLVLAIGILVLATFDMPKRIRLKK